MKSINQIFKDNIKIMKEPEVVKLIDYCKELEEEVIEFNQSKQYNLENKLTELVRDIYSSIIVSISDDKKSIRFEETPRIDFKDSINNLKNYILKFAKDNKFRL